MEYKATINKMMLLFTLNELKYMANKIVEIIIKLSANNMLDPSSLA